MGKVIWHTSMSLDGFIAGPEDDMGWMSRMSGPERVPIPEAIQAMEPYGAAMGGRRAYDVGREGRFGADSKLFGGAWSGPVFVLTHRPAPDDEEDPDYQFIGGDIRAAVATALAAADGKNLLILGKSIAEQCIDAGLVDELLIHLVPILLGDGVRLFGRPGPYVELEPVSVTRTGPATTLGFRVPR